MKTELNEIISRYQEHLEQVDDWFGACVAAHPGQINCVAGCSECCRALFDITLLDAALLRTGYELLPQKTQERIVGLSRTRMEELKHVWPDFGHPWLLNYRPEEEWEQLMPDEDETPCVFLGEDGRCLLYAYRPMTCRLHGIPMVEPDGEVTFDEWCSLNFAVTNPLTLTGLRFDFRGLFAQEQMLFREFTRLLTGTCHNELDTLIPAIPLLDLDQLERTSWTKDI